MVGTIHTMIRELAIIVRVGGAHMRAYMGNVIRTVCKFWLVPDETGSCATTPLLHTSVMTLMGAAVQAIGELLASRECFLTIYQDTTLQSQSKSCCCTL